MTATQDYLDIPGLTVKQNLSSEELQKESIKRGETIETKDGVLLADTRPHTGRSAKDRFVVDNAASHDLIDWAEDESGVNRRISEENYQKVRERYFKYLENKEAYVQDTLAGAEPHTQKKVRMIVANAWHALFMRNMLEPVTGVDPSFKADYTLLDFPEFDVGDDFAELGLRSKTFILVNFASREVLIAGTKYGGEMKKSVFGILNYLMPQQGIMPMHCSANTSLDGNVAIFFGLSGTGKTTLSTEPGRYLIGDDEHGWSDEGIFNFENGCYAKTLGLSEATEPEIYAASKRRGSTLENVPILDGEPDYLDKSMTENGRVSYPINFIPDAICKENLADLDPKTFADRYVKAHPKNIIMLTCDAFGVLPAVAKLSPEEAREQFLKGYTAKVAGTEQGIKEPVATFSHCFGSPFMPLRKEVYGDLLSEKIAKHNVDCWLVNTGWAGGAYGVGDRMSLKLTRSIIRRIHDGSLAQEELRKHSILGLSIPASIEMPEDSWADKESYKATATKLMDMFAEA